MTPLSEDLADRNLERLVARWADPITEERIAAARLAFLGRAASPHPFPAESPGHRSGGLAAIAAGLMICAAVFGSLFLLDSSGGTAPGQSDAGIEALIKDLADADVVRRDRAAAELAVLGAKARPLLEKAVQGSSEEIRVRGRDVLDRIALAAAGKKDAPATIELELAKQRALVQRLDAEAVEKALRIADLQRQLDSAHTLLNKQEADQAVFVRQLEVQLAQIAELTKKVDELRQKK